MKAVEGCVGVRRCACVRRRRGVALVCCVITREQQACLLIRLIVKRCVKDLLQTQRQAEVYL